MKDFWEAMAQHLRDDFAAIRRSAPADHLICTLIVGYGTAKKGILLPNCEIKTRLIAQPEEIAFPMVIDLMTFFLARKARKPFFSSLVISLEIKPRGERPSIKRLYEVKVEKSAIYLRGEHVIREGWLQ